MKGTLATAVGASALSSIGSPAKTTSVEIPTQNKIPQDTRQTLDKDDMLYACFMDIQKFNYERGWISKERYDKIRQGKVVTQKVGRITYLIPA